MHEFLAIIAHWHQTGSLELKPWEQVNLLEYLCTHPGDESELAGDLIAGPIPKWRLDEFLDAAAETGNEHVALRLLSAGAESRPLSAASRSGANELVTALVEAGARINRRFASEPSPIELAIGSPNPGPTARVLAHAGCDLTVRSSVGKHLWELATPELGEELRNLVGAVGPRWFRESQREGIDHYKFVDDGVMFGFNPNDVQTPILTGNDADGFGWPNTARQAMALLEENSRLRYELEWFAPFLEKLDEGEEFSLEDLGARVPSRRQLVL